MSGKGISIPLLLAGDGLCPQLLNAEEQAYPVANLLNAHLLEDILVHLKEVLAIDMVLPEELLVLATANAPQVFTDLVFVPVLW